MQADSEKIDLDMMRYLASPEYHRGWLKSIERTMKKYVEAGIPAKNRNTRLLFESRREELQEAEENGCISPRRFRKYISQVDEVEHKALLSS